MHTTLADVDLALINALLFVGMMPVDKSAR
ncbi:hypothetical protein FBZ94_11917 [Bradyrhizobium sacchari]|uniref:Uncharacterized protein n=1 Tax=Bradyrhizobium sacchari TaxID=1399419 RepID=A0A560J4I3_9BRAD|nr:hypothetical protein FBZ94_11917 [Bradyrhizobium sacchari]TWB66142.1 hypothetical protein FBZ95_11817 [Bradyrhizobium sacchari]